MPGTYNTLLCCMRSAPPTKETCSPLCAISLVPLFWTVNRAKLISALSPLGKLGEGNVVGGQSIYVWAKLPPGCEDDKEVVQWLVLNAGVCVVPGSR